MVCQILRSKMRISYIYELATRWHYLYNGIIVCLSLFFCSLFGFLICFLLANTQISSSHCSLLHSPEEMVVFWTMCWEQCAE